MPRPRLYADDAERQRAYRERMWARQRAEEQRREEERRHREEELRRRTVVLPRDLYLALVERAGEARAVTVTDHVLDILKRHAELEVTIPRAKTGKRNRLERVTKRAVAGMAKWEEAMAHVRAQDDEGEQLELPQQSTGRRRKQEPLPTTRGPGRRLPRISE